MAVLRSLADIEAAGAKLPREQGWPPISQQTADYVQALLTRQDRLAVQAA